MTEESASDLVAYTRALEAIIAVVSIKAGLNPNTLMANVLRDIANAAGMETLDTQRIIQERWVTRNLQSVVATAQLIDFAQIGPSENSPLEQTETADLPDVKSKLQEYKKRRSEGNSDTIPLKT